MGCQLGDYGQVVGTDEGEQGWTEYAVFSEGKLGACSRIIRESNATT
jgi:hypothetical protein